MRAAVYSGTRNIYKDMLPSMYSLLKYSNVDKIYFLIEDDIFPYTLPPEVECINVKHQKWFDPEGPNFMSKWSYMILIRAALAKLFPHLDRILSLDCDTIVRDNISELWDMPLDGYYLAAVHEPAKSKEDYKYLNAGVMMFNLKQIREDGMDDKYIEDLNNNFRFYPEQECFSALSQEYILELPSKYNLSCISPSSTQEKILHFAAYKDWYRLPLVQEFYYDPIVRNQTNEVGLDIIISFYGNTKKLEQTLESIRTTINYPIQITVVDQSFEEESTELISKYPQIHWCKIEQEIGSGGLLQYGTNVTHLSHIMYVTNGSIFTENALDTIFQALDNYSIGYMFTWKYLIEDHIEVDNNELQGKIFKREFLTRYDIHPIAANFGYKYSMNRICQIALAYLQTVDHNKRFFNFDDVIMQIEPAHFDRYGINIVETTQSAKQITIYCREHRIPAEYLLRELNYMMVKLYWQFLLIVQETPNLSKSAWICVKAFYDQYYSKYELAATRTLAEPYYKMNAQLIRPRLKTWPHKIPINIYRFLGELKTNGSIPGRYQFD